MKISPAYTYFNIKGTHYIFMTKRNAFYEVDSDFADIYKSMAGYFDNKLIDIDKIPDSLRSQYLFFNDEGYSLSEYSEAAKQLYDEPSKRTKIVFEVSSGCNLACKYCYENDNYKGFKKSSREMISREMVDQIANDLEKYLKMEEIVIGFYGGEPLLNVDIIEYIISVFSKRFSVFMFTLTTNLTLLNDRILKIIKKFNIRVHVSLDGYKDAHDFNRKHKNGNGTYDEVYNNLIKLSGEVTSLGFVTVGCTLSPSIDFKRLEKSMTEDELIKVFSEGSLNLGYLMDYDDTYYDKVYTKEQRDKFSNDIKQIREDMADSLSTDSSSSIIGRNLYLPMMKEMYTTHGARNFKLNLQKGSCVPSVHEIFVNVHGEYYPCHMMNCETEELVIGRIGEGISEEKCKRLFDISKDISLEYCGNCWASFYCERCIAAFFDPNEKTFGSEARMNYKCTKSRYVVYKNMETYLGLLKNNKLNTVLGSK